MPSMRAASEVMRASRLRAQAPTSSAHFRRERQQQLDAGRARLGFGERQLLRVLVDRRVVRAQRVDCAVGERGAQRVAVALASEAAASRWQFGSK